MQEGFMGVWDNLSFYFLPLGTLVSCLWQGSPYSGRKQGMYMQMVGRQSHMVVSVLIVTAVSANAPQAPHVYLWGRRHLHFSRPW